MNFTWLDIVLIGLLSISTLVGVLRGFIKEVLSLVSWGLAAFASYRLGAMMAIYLTPHIQEPVLVLAIAYTVVFLMALIVFSIISYMISRLLSPSGVSLMDRLFGCLYGVARATGVISILILIGYFLNLNKQDWWQDSQSIGHFEPIAQELKAYLPISIANGIEHVATDATDDARTTTAEVTSDVTSEITDEDAAAALAE